jgi:ATP-binding cassette, subfamily F, member 3
MDEPGNHLDVESVEALAEALCGFPGTVIFTSHDRHFMHRVATQVVEVRAGRVASYPGSFDDYVYRVQNEIDTGLRAPHLTTSASPLQRAGTSPDAQPPDRKARARADRGAQKKLKAVERKIARLDEEKRGVSESLMSVTDAGEAQQLQKRLSTLTTELAQLEEEWLELSADLE